VRIQPQTKGKAFPDFYRLDLLVSSLLLPIHFRFFVSSFACCKVGKTFRAPRPHYILSLMPGRPLRPFVYHAHDFAFFDKERHAHGDSCSKSPVWMRRPGPCRRAIPTQLE